jgi:hypothetical protein
VIGLREIMRHVQEEVGERDNVAWLGSHGMDPAAAMEHAETLTEILVAAVSAIAEGEYELPPEAEIDSKEHAVFAVIASALMAQFVLGYRLGLTRDSGDEPIVI